MSEVTRILDAIGRGDHHAAGQLLPLVYDELRQLAAQKLASEKPGQTLQPTALVHEAYLRLVGSQSEDAQLPKYKDRGHFFAAAATAMRRIIIDTARRKKTGKRGGAFQRQPLEAIAAPVADEELLSLDKALEKLALQDPAKARLVELRYFAGLTGEQAAAVLGMSASAVDRLWVYPRAWLRRELGFGVEA